MRVCVDRDKVRPDGQVVRACVDGDKVREMQ